MDMGKDMGKDMGLEVSRKGAEKGVLETLRLCMPTQRDLPSSLLLTKDRR